MSAQGGGGGTPLKILFQILGINEAKSALSALVPEVTKIGTAADTAGKKVGVIADSVSKSGAAGKGLTPIADNLTKIDKSAITAADSTTKVKGALDKTKTSVTGFTTASNQSTTSVEKLRTGQEGLVSTGTKVSGVQDKVSKSTIGVKTSADAATGSISKTTKSQNDLSSSSGKTTGSLDKQKGSLKGVADESKGTEGGLTKVKGATDQVAGSSEKASTKQTTLRSAFSSSMGAAASLGGGITSLWQTYDSLGDAQLRVDKATNTLHTTQTKIQSLQIQLNKLAVEGKEGTDQYRLVEEKLNIAQDKLVASQGTLQNAQEDLNITQAAFYQRIIPETISVLGGFTTLLSNSGGLLGKFKAGLSSLSIEALKTSSVMKLISISNPFFLAITIGASLVTAFVTNLFGFRDAINGVGVALGNALGPLKPFLTMIGDLGKGLVDMLGMGGEAAKAYGDTTTEAMGQAGTAFDQSGKKVEGYVSLTDSVIRRADGTIAGFTTDFNTNVGNMGKAMPGLSTAVGDAVLQSNTHFQKLIRDAQVTSAAIKKEFSAAFDLQGIKISGLPTGTEHPQKLGTGKEGDQPLGQGVKGTLSQLNLQVVSDGAGKLIGNFNVLVAAVKKLGLNGAQTATLWNKLTNELGITFLKTSQNINGTDDLANSLKILQDPTASVAEKNKLLGQSNTLVAGTTQNLQAAQSGVAGSLGDVADATEQMSAGQKKMKGDSDQLAASLNIYNDILNNSSLMNDVVTQGQVRQAAAMAQAKVEVLGNGSASLTYAHQLRTLEGQAVAVAEGMVKQQDALNQAKAAMLGNAGALALLSQASVMADAKNVAYQDGIYNTELALKRQQIETEGTRGEITALIDEQIRGEAQTTAYNKGLFDQEKQFQLDKIAVSETEGRLAALSDEWARGEAQSLAFTQGVQKQALQFEEDRKRVFELRGTLNELISEWNTGEVASIAFNTAFTEQEITAVKNREAVEGLRGTFSALVQEYANGITRFNSINKGFEEQKTAVYTAAAASDELRGKTVALMQDIESGIGPLQQYIEGFREQENTFNSSALVTSKLNGTISALADELNRASTDQRNFNQAATDEKKVILDSVVAFERYQGTVDEYSTAIQAGLPQAIAFSDAISKTKMALMEQEVATNALLGTTLELLGELDIGSAAITRFNSGYAQGYNDIVKWAGGIEEAKGAASGSIDAFDEVALKVGVDIPQGFEGSMEQAKQFVEVMAGVPGTMEKVVGSMEQAGKSITDGLTKSLKEGGKDVDEEMKKIAQETGLTLTDEMQDTIKNAKMGEIFVDQMGAAINTMATYFKGNPTAMKKAADNILGTFEKAVAHNPALASMRGELEKAIAAVKLHPESLQAWSQLGDVMGRIRTAGSLTNTVFGNMNGTLASQTAAMGNVNAAWKAYADNLGNININQAISDFKSLTTQADAAQQAIRRYNDENKVSLNQMKASGDTRYQEDLQVAVGDKIPKEVGGGGDPFAAQNAALEAYKQKLGELPNLVNAVVTQINTAFTTMGTSFGTTVTQMSAAAGAGAVVIGSALAAGFTTAGTYITTLSSNFGTQVTAMGKAAAAGGILIGTLLATGFQQAEIFANTSMQAINTMATGMATNMRTVAITAGTAIAVGFQQGEKFANTSLQAILRMATLSMTAMGKAAAAAGLAIGAGIRTGETVANTSIQSVLRMATLSFPKIGQAAASAGKSIGTGIQGGVNAANSALSNMQSRASSAFSSIVSSANRATSSVRQLASSINALKSKTVTITTVYRRVIQTVYAAKGFGPAMVDSPMNLTVGENGPEMVSVIPMSDAGGYSKNITMPTSITNNRISSSSHKTGISNMIGGGGDSSSYSNSINNTSQESVINRFNESVARISNTFDRQESRMVSSNIQNISSVRTGGSATTYGGGVSNYNTTNVPNISTVRNGNVYNTGGTGGGSVQGVVAMVKDIITSAFAQTTINVTSQSIMDSDLVYEKQKKQFGLRNGAVLK